jgi:hypothetical protein
LHAVEVLNQLIHDHKDLQNLSNENTPQAHPACVQIHDNSGGGGGGEAIFMGKLTPPKSMLISFSTLST